MGSAAGGRVPVLQVDVVDDLKPLGFGSLVADAEVLVCHAAALEGGEEGEERAGEEDDHCEVPAELQIGQRFGLVRGGLRGAADGFALVGNHHGAVRGQERGRPEHEPHLDEPRTLEDKRHAAHDGDCRQVADEYLHHEDQSSHGDGELEEPVVVPFQPHVVRGVEVEQQQLLAQRNRSQTV